MASTADMEPITIDTSLHSTADTTESNESPASLDTASTEQSPASPPPEPRTPTARISPRKAQDAHMSTDSMASIALSDTSLDYDHLSAEQLNDVLATPKVTSEGHLRKPNSMDIMRNSFEPPTRQSTLFDAINDETPQPPAEGAKELHRDDVFGGVRPNDVPEAIPEVASPPPSTMPFVSALVSPFTSRLRSISSVTTESKESNSAPTPRKSSVSSEETVEVDWQQLDKNEEQEKEDLARGAEDESTAFLLARLEQENAKFSTDPKSAIPKHVSRTRSASRPPSMGHLKKLVENRDTPSVRYSMTPDMALPQEPPPMTELEFWAALVQDYPSTATRLPTLTTSKIRSGIPPPLRGVVWTSMSGARERFLEDSFEKLLDEKSPYEGIINKDVGRSFPGVELFRDADGEGQKMLGRVLKCYSLHDQDIGYCQGLGFLVGPLLMNMGERDAFCVLVRLMEHYDLRPSFLPSLSGLHMRIFQFSCLLKQHLPTLSDHFNALGVEPAYLSQWFLSCFAVTCPLPLLFRIYDVIFAEGANETVMRVAMALMRRNEQQMLESTEFDEVMQLLLGRAMWDSYACNADELVDDFTSLGHVITHTRLAELEKEFESQSSEAVGQSAGFLPSVQGAAGRFLGRLWAPSTVQTPKANTALSPMAAEKEPSSASSGRSTSFFLRRSPSKQSINTINESNSSESSANSFSTASYASTTPTETETSLIRDSNADTMSLKSKAESLNPIGQVSREQQDLHGQIEDLLTALSEMQREHAQLTSMLQKEREERTEDHRFVRQLVGKLHTSKQVVTADETTTVDERRKTMPPPPRDLEPKARPVSLQPPSVHGTVVKDELSSLVEKIEHRLDNSSRFSVSFETKAQIRSNLTRTREQLATAEMHSRELASQLEMAENNFQIENEELRSEVRELRDRVGDEFKTRQKLEYTITEMKAEARSMERKAIERETLLATAQPPSFRTEMAILEINAAAEPSSVPNTMSKGGLRELRLGKRESTTSMNSMRALPRRRQSEIPQGAASQTPIFPSPPLLQQAWEEESVSTPPITPAEEIPEPQLPTIPSTPATDPTTSHHRATASRVSNLSIPPPGAESPFGKRTSSLATGPGHARNESIAEDALLLELVNAKTAEAEARQEVDEIRRALSIQKQNQERLIAQLHAEAAAAREEAKKAVDAAEAARVRADSVSSMRSGASRTPSLTVPVTPGGYGETKTTELQLPPKKGGNGGATPTSATAAAASVGNWFWGRRSASTQKEEDSVKE